MNSISLPLEHRIKELFWDEYKKSTSTFSSICRQLAFAEGGICWLFKTQGQKLPLIFLITLTFLVVFFILDAWQYHEISRTYRKCARKYEKEVEEGRITAVTEIYKDTGTNKSSKRLFNAKLYVLSGASVFLIIGFLKCMFCSC